MEKQLITRWFYPTRFLHVNTYTYDNKYFFSSDIDYYITIDLDAEIFLSKYRYENLPIQHFYSHKNKL